MRLVSIIHITDTVSTDNRLQQRDTRSPLCVSYRAIARSTRLWSRGERPAEPTSTSTVPVPYRTVISVLLHVGMQEYLTGRFHSTVVTVTERTTDLGLYEIGDPSHTTQL